MRPQKLVLGLVFILSVTSGMQGCSEIPRFAEDPQFLQVVEYLTEGEEIQEDLTELSKWTNMWQMNFSVRKCGVPTGKNYLYQACMMLNLEQLRKKLGIIVSSSLKSSAQRAMAAKNFSERWPLSARVTVTKQRA